MTKYILSREKAVSYIEDRLSVKDVEQKLEKDRTLLLNEIICSFMKNLPFQTITIACKPLEERRVPTIEDVIAKGLALEGGVCIDLNYFMRTLLESLGYNVQTIGANYTADLVTPFTHVATIVRGLETPDDVYLVDVGCGYPQFVPIPLHKLPFSFLACGMEVKYIQEGEKYFRLQRKGDFITDDLPPVMKDGGWRSVFDFDLTPRDYSFFQDSMIPFFIDGPFLEDMHLVRFPGKPGEEMIAIKDHTLYSYGKNVLSGSWDLGTTVQKQHIDDSQLEVIITKNFPGVKQDELKIALQHYRKVWTEKEQANNGTTK